MVDGRRAQRPYVTGLRRGARGEHFGTPRAGQLHGHMAHATGAAVHQHLVPAAHVGAVHQALPGGDEDQRQGRCLAHGQPARLVGQQPGIHRSVLRQAALQPADAAGKAIHRIPHLEARDALPHLLHHAGEVHAQNGGQWLLGVLGGAGADLGVQRVHAAGVDADKHLARSGLRPGQPGRGQCAVGGCEHQGLHVGGGRGGHDVFLRGVEQCRQFSPFAFE